MSDYLKVVENLKRRCFDAYYFENRDEAISKVLEFIKDGDTVGFGGSQTIEALNIKGILNEKGHTLYYKTQGKTPDEQTEILRKSLLTDVFIMSSNAITEDGRLYNIDGRGNRVAALSFGPKSVIVIAGKNKIVKTMEEAYDRVRNIAAPKNSLRLDCKTPCIVDMKCHDCKSPECICAQMVETRLSKPKDKIKVILIGEDLGF